MKPLLFYDIETAATLIEAWGIRKVNALRTVKDWELISIAYRWSTPGSPVVVKSRRTHTEEQLVQLAHKIMSMADFAVAHNGLKFDTSRLRAKFAQFRTGPNNPLETIDTLKESRKSFGLISYRLNDVARFLGTKRKLETGGYDLWVRCIEENDPKAWKTMEEYNATDVQVLEEVYRRISPYIDAGGFVLGHRCPRPLCRSKKLVPAGLKRNKTLSYYQYQCLKCGGFCRERTGPVEKRSLICT